MTRRAITGVSAFAVGLWMTQAPGYLTDFSGPGWARIGLLLLPWLVFGALYRLARRYPYEDELDIFINRRALAFAFYAALLGSIALTHLEAAGVIPAINWTGKGLMTALALLLLLGLALSKLRFR